MSLSFALPMAQHSRQSNYPRRILFLSARTSRLVSQLPGVMHDPDSYGNRVGTLRIADFDGDGEITFSDFNLLAIRFGLSADPRILRVD